MGGIQFCWGDRPPPNLKKKCEIEKEKIPKNWIIQRAKTSISCRLRKAQVSEKKRNGGWRATSRFRERCKLPRWAPPTARQRKTVTGAEKGKPPQAGKAPSGVLWGKKKTTSKMKRQKKGIRKRGSRRTYVVGGRTTRPGLGDSCQHHAGKKGRKVAGRQKMKTTYMWGTWAGGGVIQQRRRKPTAKERGPDLGTKRERDRRKSYSKKNQQRMGGGGRILIQRVSVEEPRKERKARGGVQSFRIRQEERGNVGKQCQE